MADYLSIESRYLQLDEENPRVEDQPDQQAAIAALLEEQENRLVELAKDVIKFGFDPSTLPIVVPSDEHPDHYVVVEGNRRVAIARLLLDPALLPDETSPAVARRFRKLAAKVSRGPLEKILCCVLPSREEADHWIELRHTGMNKGAGLVQWTGAQTARDAARRGKKKPAHQLLQMVTSEGVLSGPAREVIAKGRFHITNLGRLISDPNVRQALGIEKTKEVVELGAKRESALRAVSYVVERIATGSLAVGDIYDRDKRLAFLKTLPQGLLYTAEEDTGSADRDANGTDKSEANGGAATGDAATHSDGSSSSSNQQSDTSATSEARTSDADDTRPSDSRTESSSGSGTANTSESQTSDRSNSGGNSQAADATSAARRSPDRRLIPKDFNPQCSGRIRDLVEEGKRLHIRLHTNACSIFLRVLLELAMDEYHARWQVPAIRVIEDNPKSPPPTLKTKLLAVREDLLDRKVMKKDALQAVRRAADSGKTLLAASVGTLNEYVHNRHFNPDPDSVRAAWSNLAPFIHTVCEEAQRPPDRRTT